VAVLRTLGTRGFTDARSETHAQHTCLLLDTGEAHVLIDRGESWRGKRTPEYDIALVTHGHPDHVGGFRETERADGILVAERSRPGLPDWAKSFRLLESEKPAGVAWFAVEHSTRCPAVGYRIETDVGDVVVCPDVLSVPNRESALKGAALYVGDGSALSRSLVRRAPNGDLVGHASIALQVRWCEEAGIPHAIFVHFGKECISMGDEELRDALAGLSEKVRVEVAADGQKFVIDGSSKREVLPSELSPDAVTPTWLEGLTDVELRAVHKELHRLWSKL